LPKLEGRGLLRADVPLVAAQQVIWRAAVGPLNDRTLRGDDTVPEVAMLDAIARSAVDTSSRITADTNSRPAQDQYEVGSAHGVFPYPGPARGRLSAEDQKTA
jgi:hypothetical protein